LAVYIVVFETVFGYIIGNSVVFITFGCEMKQKLTNKEIGRLGGLKTVALYGQEHMKELGKLGGRPRLPTLQEIRDRKAKASNINNNKGVATGGYSLKELKLMWASRTA